MLGKTHITAGITSALLIARPTSMLGFVSAVTGGALGGAICDIDCKGSDINRETTKGALLAAILIAAAFVLDIRIGNGLIDYLRRSFGTVTLLGCAGFLVCCIIGYLSEHRTFSHSVLFLLGMTLSAFCICQPFANALFVGILSHILLDLLNKRSIRLCYPLPQPRFCLRLCSSDGKVNAVLLTLFTAAAVLLTLLFGYRTLTGRDLPVADFISYLQT